MKLNRLEIRNFKGITSFVLDAKGKDLNIYGANQTGKTTIADAFAWLLFDKDSLERKAFGIKPVGKSGVDSTVDAEVEIDGNMHQLIKTYKEVWTKPRGKAKAEFTGHTTDYWIDGVPADKKADYDGFIKGLVSEDSFKLLTNPRYFNEVMEWKKRRELLMSMCGVSGEDMKATDDKLKIIKADRQKLNKAIAEIPTRIDEAQRALPEDPGAFNYPAFEKAKDKLKALQEKRASISTSGQVADIQRQITEVDTELLQVKNQQSEKIQADINRGKAESLEIEDHIHEIESDISQRRRQCSALAEEEKGLNEKREKLLKEWHEINNIVFDESKASCPTCGRVFDSDKVKDIKHTFNANKSDSLEKINKDGKAVRSRLEEIKQQDTALTTEINALNKRLEELKEKANFHKASIESLEGLKRGVEGLPEYKAIAEKKEALTASLQQAKQGINTDDLDNEIAEITKQIAGQETIQATIKQREAGIKRIEELKAEEKRLTEQFEQVDKDLFETEGKLRETVTGLEDQINSQFEHVSFKLFNELINGGIEDCCIAKSKDGVEYTDMSNSQRIRAGLDIIKAFSRYYGIECPVFVDNSEACDHLIDMPNQLISLIVSGKDKKLRIEAEQIKEQGVLV
ncbi:AAA family ATPase [Chloroflexota bacterium]